MKDDKAPGVSEDDYKKIIIQMVEGIHDIHTLKCIYSYTKVKYNNKR